MKVPGFYPRPHMLNLRSDHRVHRILVPVPVLTASINHSAVGTFDYISEQTECFIKRRPSVQSQNEPGKRGDGHAPRPGVFGEAHPGRV